MSNVIIKQDISIEQNMARMRADACFDVADNADTGEEELPDLQLFNDIKAPPAPPTVPKLFLSGDCIFNCAYCGCRCSRDRERYTNEPRALAAEAVKVNSGKGVFITSAIHRNADYTQELICETIRIMRREYDYRNYIHAKVMPGADPALIARTGQYASRLSVNIEVAQASGYERIAHNKNRSNILGPMGTIAALIQEAKAEKRGGFAVSQTTQLMAGSTEEDDRTIVTLSQALYQKYKLKRVYYTPFMYQNHAIGYDLPLVATPRWRMKRLYQADRLLQLYQFSPNELTPESHPFLEESLDPKAAWALRNLHLFPMEINTADYEQLLRIPGIGVTYAHKILRARCHCALTHEHLKKLGVSLKRAVYFITCKGKYLGGTAIDSEELRTRLAGEEQLSMPSEVLQPNCLRC